MTPELFPHLEQIHQVKNCDMLRRKRHSQVSLVWSLSPGMAEVPAGTPEDTPSQVVRRATVLQSEGWCSNRLHQRTIKLVQGEEGIPGLDIWLLESP